MVEPLGRGEVQRDPYVALVGVRLEERHATPRRAPREVLKAQILLAVVGIRVAPGVERDAGGGRGVMREAAAPHRYAVTAARTGNTNGP